jgi:hypothetical protein
MNFVHGATVLVHVTVWPLSGESDGRVFSIDASRAGATDLARVTAWPFSGESDWCRNIARPIAWSHARPLFFGVCLYRPIQLFDLHPRLAADPFSDSHSSCMLDRVF